MAGLFDDPGYTGEVPDSGSVTQYASLDFYRNKIREFQVALNELDATAKVMRDFAALPVPPAEYDAAVQWLTDYETNRAYAVAAAEAINLASNTANAAGIRMPVVSWQMRGVGAFPPLMIAAVASAVGAGAWFLSYAIDRISAAKEITAMRDTIAMLPENERAAALRMNQEITLAKARAENPIASIANVVKWVALGVAGFFAYRAFEQMRAG
jgi:hypothetical protein